MNPIWLRSFDRLRKSLCEQIAQARAGAKHPTLKGNAIEAVLRKTLRKYLPTRYGVASGLVANRQHEFSPQVDVLIFDQTTFPPLLVNEDDSVVIAAESVYSFVELKVSWNTKLLRSHFEGCAAVDRARRSASAPDQSAVDWASYFLVTYKDVRNSPAGVLGDPGRLVGVCPLKGQGAWLSPRGHTDFEYKAGNTLAQLLDWMLKDCMQKYFVDVGANENTRRELAPYFGWDTDEDAE